MDLHILSTCNKARDCIGKEEDDLPKLIHQYLNERNHECENITLANVPCFLHALIAPIMDKIVVLGMVRGQQPSLEPCNAHFMLASTRLLSNPVRDFTKFTIKATFLNYCSGDPPLKRITPSIRRKKRYFLGRQSRVSHGINRDASCHMERMVWTQISPSVVRIKFVCPTKESISTKIKQGKSLM